LIRSILITVLHVDTRFAVRETLNVELSFFPLRKIFLTIFETSWDLAGRSLELKDLAGPI
jgi:hypothetical protein